MKFEIIKKSELEKTYRVSAVIGAFDLDVKKLEERFLGEIELNGKSWSIGVIVGGSGTGKTTIATELFGERLKDKAIYTSKSVIDDMPSDKTVKEITKAFTSVGFSSPPSWLKPYTVLSNGEKMRCDLAYSILSSNELIVFDEFTSVVNREVAKTGSYAIQKEIRKANKKFIAVTCHSDVLEWLEPDWVYNTDEQRFFFAKENTKDPKSKLMFTGLATEIKTKYGTYLGSITI